MNNIIKAFPFYKQSSFNNHLIHAFHITDNKQLFEDSNYILISISNEKDLKLNNFDGDLSSNKILLNIYPPWKRMFSVKHNRYIYFGANLFEIIPFSQPLSSLFSSYQNIMLNKTLVCNLINLECNGCSSQSSQICKLNFFEIKTFTNYLKNSIKISRDHLSQSSHTNNSVSMPRNSIFTQTDADYYNENTSQQINPTNSQYMKLNSILDALENTGYYGFVSFIGTVQRVGLLKWFYNSQSSFSMTQKTQIQSVGNDNFK